MRRAQGPTSHARGVLLTLHLDPHKALEDGIARLPFPVALHRLVDLWVLPGHGIDELSKPGVCCTLDDLAMAEHRDVEVE